MYRKKYSRVLPVAVALMALAACGGDGDDQLGDNVPPPGMNPPPPPPPPVLGDTTAVMGNNVITFNIASPGTMLTSMPIQGLTAGETVVGGDYRPADGQYYVVTTGSAFYILDPATGMATGRKALASASGAVTLNAMATTFGVDFNPVPDRLRVTANTGENLRIDVGTMNAVNTTVDGGLTVVTDPANNVAPVSSVAYTNSFAAACRTALFYLDPGNPMATPAIPDRLLTAFDPNVGVLRVVGNLGVDFSGVSGFEVVTDAMGNNTLLAALNVGGTVSLYTINMTTGAATIVPSSTFSGALVGLSAKPPATAPTQAAGDVIAVTAANSLITFNVGSPAKFCTSGTAIQGLMANENVVDIDLRSSNTALYAFTDMNRLLIVNRSDGSTTNVPLTGAAVPALTAGQSYAIDVNPQADALRVVGGVTNLAINFAGAVTAQTPLAAGAGVTIPGAINSNGVAYVNAINGTSNAGTGAFTALYNIDVANDTLYLQNAPGSGQLFLPVPLGVDATSVGGFDINALSNVGVAALNVAGTTNASILYTINVNGTGTTAATLAAGTVAGSTIGGAASPTVVRGLAFQSPVVPQPMTGPILQQALTASLVGVTATAPQSVVSFSVPAAVGTITTSNPLPLSGLTDGETTVVGIDRRPADRTIWALGNLGNLYTLDPASGALTKRSTLTAGLPLTAPVAIDFNPQVDRLRVIDATGKNLRVNVVSGATTVDLAINLAGATGLTAGSQQVRAAAYSNNFFGTLPAPVVMGSPVPVPPRAGTVLFDIDVGNDRLFQQSPPNDGTLANLPGVTPAIPLVAGPLGADFGQVADFDIIGGSNSFALAILQPPASMGSALYRVNLLPSLPSNADTAGGAIAPGTATLLGGSIVDPSANPLTLGTFTIFLAPSPTM